MIVAIDAVDLVRHFPRARSQANDLAGADGSRGFGLRRDREIQLPVVGIDDAKTEAVMREVYAPLLADDVPMVVCDFETAELVKVAANSFLATKISFINAMAELCESVGADVISASRAGRGLPRSAPRSSPPPCGGCRPPPRG